MTEKSYRPILHVRIGLDKNISKTVRSEYLSEYQKRLENIFGKEYFVVVTPDNVSIEIVR